MRVRSGFLGPAVLAAVAVGYPVVWLLAAPAGQPAGLFAGEICGAEAVLLFSCSLVLLTLLPFIEHAFGGLDRVVVWHRRVAFAGFALLVAHVALITSTPDPFETTLGHAWGRRARRAAGADRVGGSSSPARRALARADQGARPHVLRALAWRTPAHGPVRRGGGDPWRDRGSRDAELERDPSRIRRGGRDRGGRVCLPRVARALLRAGLRVHRRLVHRLGERTIEIALDPTRKRLAFQPGQFIVLAFGGAGAWQRHPFSISSAASDRRLDVTIKAGGDYTSRLVDDLRPGVPAKVVGPFGEFDYRRGGHEQIWIAGGIGVTPFMSWIRSLDGRFDREVDFYYSVRAPAEAVYRDEIEAATKANPSLRVHYVYSNADGTLTADEVLRHVAPDERPSIYMCGPPAMMQALASGFRRRGVPPSRVRYEQFASR
jgi:predicted ferric reductase